MYCAVLWYLDYIFLLFFFNTGNSARFKPANQGTLTILGLHLTMLPFKMMSFFTNKKEVQKSATALGYVGHVRSTFSLLDINYKVVNSYMINLDDSTLKCHNIFLCQKKFIFFQ